MLCVGGTEQLDISWLSLYIIWDMVVQISALKSLLQTHKLIYWQWHFLQGAYPFLQSKGMFKAPLLLRNHIITLLCIISYNHTTVWIRRDFSRSSSPTPCCGQEYFPWTAWGCPITSRTSRNISWQGPEVNVHFSIWPWKKLAENLCCILVTVPHTWDSPCPILAKLHIWGPSTAGGKIQGAAKDH